MVSGEINVKYEINLSENLQNDLFISSAIEMST
jgi:hypothetical protein